MRLVQSKDTMLRLTLQGFWRGTTEVLGPISLMVAPGETVALTGPSGVGKTTLLRIIAGLETGYKGAVDVQGRLAFVFQEPTLLPWRTVEENIILTTGVDADAARLALAEVGLEDRAHDVPGQLSLGQQRRLSLARAFALKPHILLMDEPFVSLDAELAEEMMALFASLRAKYKVTTVFVTHAEQEARALASRIVRLGGAPAAVVMDVQNKGAYFQLSASGVTSSKS